MDYQLIDPNELYELQALQLIDSAESSEKELVPVTTTTSAIEDIVIYLRASYAILDHYQAIKVSQDTSANANI